MQNQQISFTREKVFKLISISCLNEPSNSFSYFFKSILESITSTKVEQALQPTFT
jgi:hypothetical protein